MRQLKSISELREQLNTVRKADKKIILVPTMGNLHDGHLSLVKQAQKIDGLIVTTIFVNPTQFVAGEDFDSYPRTLENDLSLLEQLNPDIVFIPDTNEIYPDSQIKAEIIVPELDSIYCGEFRPGHFRGVATVVTKLFNIVQPDIAIFGEKDYQQLLVIRSLVQSLDLPVEIVGSATVREADGLAMSSRNSYLTDEERRQAPILYECLCGIADAIKQGDSNFEKLEKNGLNRLKESGFRPEYLNICDAETLKEPKNHKLVIICAAWLGKARLIDNVAVHTYD